MKKTKSLSLHVCVALGCALLTVAGCHQSPPEPKATVSGVTFKPQEMADALHAVIAADRDVYARHVVQRLQDEGFVLAAEQWKERKALPLPEHMLRLASDSIQREGAEFHYALRSLWASNPRNAPETDTEKAGLQFVLEHPGSNYYSEESLGGRRYFTAVYADVATVSSCVECHNQLQNSPRKNFKTGQVMGGMVVRVPLEF